MFARILRSLVAVSAAVVAFAAAPHLASVSPGQTKSTQARALTVSYVAGAKTQEVQHHYP